MLKLQVSTPQITTVQNVPISTKCTALFVW